MKRFLTLLILFASTLQVSAQSAATSRRPLWVGLDLGGTWQTSDMKALGGIGWSFTLSRYSKLDKTGPLYYGWRFRFLDGRNYGYNYHRLYGLGSDPVMSSGATNYATPTANNDGYVFSNYKYRFDEFAYEIIVGSNGLRKHGVLLYGFGGVGLNHSRTTTNQLDEFDNKYDYSTITNGGNDDVSGGDLQSLWKNGNYETNANGSTSSGKWSFVPSAGFGLGYQFGNAFAIGVEHRTTWARTDNIDGVNHDYTGAPTPNNDLYNYDGLFIRWTFGGNSRSHNSTTNTNVPDNPNNYSTNPPYTPPPTNPNNTTTVTPPNNPPNPSNTNPPAIPLPYVNFTTPGSNPYTTNVPNQQLVVRVENVAAANQITLTINGLQSTNFSFNPSTSTMVFNHILMPGTNTYQVVAFNQAGSASDVQTIIYNNGTTTTTVVTPPSELPPQVTITNPASDPYTSSVASMNVTATVLNVSTMAGIQVRRNGSPVTNFSFDPGSHIVTFLASLQAGNNLYEVIGTNSVGSASDQVTIIYSSVASVQPPVVTITAPSSCPFSVKSAAYTITANITNVTAANQVSIIFNNQVVSQFNFVNNGSYATVSFPVTLNPGANPFTITGTNVAGSNSKSCEITLKVTTPTPVVPPVVTITNPASSPYTSPTQAFTLAATVLNVNSQSEITVTMNNSVVTMWTYSMTSHVLTFPSSLVIGNNAFVVSASNVNGSDSKSAIVNYLPAPKGLPPVVTITNPTANPYTSTVQVVPVTAQVLNVTQASQITVNSSLIGPVAFTFNPSTHLAVFDATMTSRSITFTVTATNPDGTASDDITIKYVPEAPVDNGRPQDGPGGTTPPTVAPPTVTFTVPSANPYTSTVQEFPATAQVMNVTQSSQISVNSSNNGPVTFTFNPTTHLVVFNVAMSTRQISYTVTATNSAGSASDDVTVKYQPEAPVDNHRPQQGPGSTPGNLSSGNTPPPPATPVTIDLVIPASDPTVTHTQTESIKMKVMGVNAASEISVKLNGVAVTNFAFDVNTHFLTFSVTLNSGANSISVTAQNSNGTATKTIGMKYTATGRTSGPSGGTPRTATPSTAPSTTPTTTPTTAPKPR